MKEKRLSITCPLCGRKNEYRVETLVEGFVLTCPLCKVKLSLHGHMWEEIQRDIRKLDDGK